MSDPDTPNDVPTPQDLLDDVALAPEGPEVGAFFDFDGTVIAGHSVVAFMRHHVRTLDVRLAPTVRTLIAGAQGLETEEDFTEFLSITLRSWAGRRPEDLATLGRRLFRDEIGPTMYPEAWRLVPRAPRARSHRRPRLLGDALPGRPRGRRARGGARGVHRPGGRRRGPAHRAARRAHPLRRGEGRRGEGLRRRARHRPRRELRLLQRQRGRRVPRPPSADRRR